MTLRQVLIALCATFGTAVYAFTWNSVTVALPHLQGAFSATTDQIAWVMIAFVIGSAMTTACVGWFSDWFGRRQMFLLGVAGFTVTLIGCGAATTLEEILIWRFLQGTFGAISLPLGQMIAVNAFPPNRYGQATSLWALGFVSSNVLAPSLGGLIVEELGWQWVFYAPVPLGVAVCLGSWILVPATPKDQRPMAWAGFTTLLVGVGMLQLVLARGERLDWFESPEIVIEAVVAIAALYFFVVHTIIARRPFFDRALFLDRDFMLGQLFAFLIGGVLFLPLFLLPLLLQQIAGYPAVDTGYLVMFRGVGSILGLLIMSQFRDRFDPRPFLIIGLLVTAFSTWSMAHWTVEIRPWNVIWTNFLLGIATGAIFAPLNTLTLSRLSAQRQGQGFAMFYLSFDIGSAIGTAAVVGLHARHSQINRSVLAEHVTPFSELIRTMPLPDVWSLSEASGLAAIELEVTRQATMIAYNNSFLAISAVLATLIPVALLFRRRQTAQTEG